MKFEIKKMGINGEGIAYLKQKPVFIPGAFIGEFVEATILDETKTYANAKLDKIIRKSKNRVKKVCTEENCNACSLMELHIREQAEQKRQVVAQSLYKYAGITLDKIKRIQYNETVFNYRNQLKMPIQEYNGRICCGMYLPNSNVFVPIKRCKVHEIELDEVRCLIEEILNMFHASAYDKKTKKGFRTLVLRHLDGKFQCTFVTGNEIIDRRIVDAVMAIEGMVNVGQSINTVHGPDIFGSPVKVIAGDEVLPFTFGGLKLQIANQAFFQLNTKQALNLYKGVYNLLKDQHYGTIVEAYSGIGVISFMLAPLADEIIGIESIQSAVDNANENALLNHLNHIHFRCNDARKEIQNIVKEKEVDVVVVDPPRSGLSEEFIHCLLETKPEKIVYVSCNLSTLGKNLADLQKEYNVEKVIPYDIFTHTAHVETVVLLSQRKADD